LRPGIRPRKRQTAYPGVPRSVRSRAFAAPLALLVAIGTGLVGLTTVVTTRPAAADQTTCPTSIALGNGDFEAPAVGAGAGLDRLDTNPAVIWKTTEADHDIEYWGNGGSSTGANGGLAITAQSGTQWVELNANQPSTLYQDLTTIPGQVMRWSLWHRARYTGIANGQDVMAVLIGTPAALVQQGANISDGPTAWINTTGSYVVPAGQTTTRFAFRAISTASGNASIGNFLDNITFGNAPCLSTTKTVNDLTPGAGGLIRPGDTLRYTVTANNSGGDVASNATVTDPVPANTTYVPGSLVVSGTSVSDATDGDTGEISGGTLTGRIGAGATSTTGGTVAAGSSTTMTYKVTVDPGDPPGTAISNTSSTTYQWSPSPTVFTATSNTTSDTVSTTGISVVKSISGTSDVNGDGKLSVGDQVSYSFLVTNTASAALTSVGVNDSKATVSCPSTTLAGGGSETCTATYTVTQADVDGGSVLNSATATGTPPSGAAPITSSRSATSQPLDQGASLTMVKSGSSADTNADGSLDVGDNVTYHYLVTNTGSVTESSLTIADPHPGLSAINCPSTSLGSGATTTCTATYPIAQADLDAGVVANTATASGRTPGGALVTSAPSTVDVTLPGVPAVTLAKSATVTDVNNDVQIDLGDTIAWSFLVKNTGNVTLSLSVADPTAGHVTCPVSSLSPGDTTTCSADLPHTITQADVDAGVVSNTATVSGTDPGGDSATSAPSSTDTPVVQTVALALLKHAAVSDTNGDGSTDKGDTITWTFTLTNTGTTTIHALSVADTKAGAVTCPSTVTPGASVTCTASPYPITQADVDAGVVNSTATGSGLGPAGNAVISLPSTTSTTVAQTSTISLLKSAAVTDVDGDGVTDLGDTIAWSFNVTNSGTTTVNTVTVNDPTAGNVTCPSGALAPGASLTCTADLTYTITQADVDAGHVTNTATAQALDPGGTLVLAPSSSVTTAISDTANVTLVKHAAIADTNGDGRAGVGDTITWTFTLTNSGNRTLTGLNVIDPIAGSVSCPATTLAPGAGATCTGDTPHVVTQADVDAGVVSNTASAQGNDPLGNPVTSNPSSTDTPLDQIAAVRVVKKGVPTDTNGDGVTDAGDTIAWTFTVTNTGLVTLHDVGITDTKAGPVTCQHTTLAPGASTSCAADQPYTITKADVDVGSVHNVATADARCGCAATVMAAQAAAVVPTTHSAAHSPSGIAGLPFTGANQLPWTFMGGLVALVAGGWLLMFGRRRRT
jgi:uncharacterized repeat protein (TIGR01451 family)